MKTFKEYLNEIKLGKFSGFNKGDTVEFNDPNGVWKDTNKYNIYRGVVKKDTTSKNDKVEVVSKEYQKDYGDAVVKLDFKNIKGVV